MQYDVVVLGSGPGGYTAAIRAGQYGLKAAIIEKDSLLGGTCLLVGCIPSKALLHAAELWDYVKHSSDYGIEVKDPKLDLPAVIKRKDGIVVKHAKGIEMLMKKNKVDVIKGFGRLQGANKIEVEGEGAKKTVETKSIILATGSSARMLPGLEPDEKLIFTNIEILKNTEVPGSLGVIGAGAVGVEFASMFHRFGSQVTIFEMLPRLVPIEDEEISTELARVFKKMGIRSETGARVEKVERAGQKVKVSTTLSSGKQETFEFDKLLVGVGRKPMTDDIGLDTIEVETDRGYIKTDGYMRTGTRGVYAIGDIVAGMPWLAHAASMEGLIAVAHIAGKPVQPMRKDRVPGVTFTEPGIGSIGLTEAQARAQGYKVRVGKFPFVGNSKASILGHHDGFVKVVADETFGEILGVHIIGPHAYEMIGEAVAAIEAEATVETMMQTIHAHPTLYEAMGDGFNAVYGMAINA